MVKKTLESRPIYLFCDFHGHSRSRNAFIYGCSGSKDLSPSENPLLNGFKHREKVFPYIMSKNCEYFNFDNCNFSIHKAKESTGRVVIYREFYLAQSYTLECSFFGPTRGSQKDCHFNISMLLEIGEQFCKTLFDMSEKDQAKVNQAIKDLKRYYKKPLTSVSNPLTSSQLNAPSNYNNYRDSASNNYYNSTTGANYNQHTLTPEDKSKNGATGLGGGGSFGHKLNLR